MRNGEKDNYRRPTGKMMETKATRKKSRHGPLTNNFLLEDRCASSDQMSFFSTFRWRGFVFVMRDRNRPNKDGVAILTLTVTTKDFPHDMLLPKRDELMAFHNGCAADDHYFSGGGFIGDRPDQIRCSRFQ